MASQVMAFPLIPGKRDEWLKFVEEGNGPRRAEYAESRRQLGVQRESVFLQETPMGDMVVVSHDADDVPQAFARLAASQSPFDLWFKENVRNFNGVDLAAPPAGPLPTAGFQWQAEGHSGESPSVAMAFPILPGKLDDWRAFSAEMAGPRKADHAASRQKAGIHREEAFHQQTPMGDFAVVYMEADDPNAAFMHLGTSQEPFDAWFRQNVHAIHGADLAAPPAGPLPQRHSDVRTG